MASGASLEGQQWAGDSERPRERLLARGAASLTDAELIALVLGASSRGTGGVLRTSHQLLGQMGGLTGLSRTHPSALVRVSGIGQARACALAAVLELARRVDHGARHRGAPVRSSRDAYQLLRRHLALLDHEVFVVLALDAKHRVLTVQRVAQGGRTSVEVHPREVFAPLLRGAAAAAIVAHNHPSGDAEPSGEDLQLTRRLMRAAELMCIPLLDHLVIGAGTYVSLAERGCL